MNLSIKSLAAAAVSVAAIGATAGTAAASQGAATVYSSTNDASGNAVAVFRAAPGRALRQVASAPTGGLGTGASLGDQGAIARAGRYLYVVNAGSNDITSFRIDGPRLRPVARVASGGTLPVSLTVQDGRAYVVNRGGAGNVTGFTAQDGRLEPIPGATRPLAGSNPAQVALSPDGRQLVVTEKDTNTLDVLAVGADGHLGPAVSHPSHGATPFGFAFTRSGVAIVSEAGGGTGGLSAVSSYALDSATGDLTTLTASLEGGQAAACWVVTSRDGRFAYAANTGSATITGLRVGDDGRLSLLDPSGVTATTGAGPADLARTPDGGEVFVRNGGDRSISAYVAGDDGSLTPIGTVGGLSAGSAGLAAL